MELWPSPLVKLPVVRPFRQYALNGSLVRMSEKKKSEANPEFPSGSSARAPAMMACVE